MRTAAAYDGLTEVMAVAIVLREISSCGGRRMTAVVRTFPVLVAAGSVLCADPCRAGPQFMVYLTVPVGGAGSSERVHGGLRLDRHPQPAIQDSGFASPFTRRALLDLQMNTDAALRLQVYRAFSYDFGRGEWAGGSNSWGGGSRDMTWHISSVPDAGAAVDPAGARPWFAAAPLRGQHGDADLGAAAMQRAVVGSGAAAMELRLRKQRGNAVPGHQPTREARGRSLP